MSCLVMKTLLSKLTATFPRSVGQIPIYYSQKIQVDHLVIQKENSKNSNLIISMKWTFISLWFWIKLHHIRLFKSKVVIRQDEFWWKNKCKRWRHQYWNYDGKEIVQLYTRDLVGSVTRPLKELKGFQKIILRKGEKRQSLLKFMSKIWSFIIQI
jgi:beta-glucosidase